jgi:anti-sigma factor RsiW
MMCAGFEERIAGYVGGDLAPKEAAEVEQHLRTCADCAELARGLEEDRAWLASRPPETAEVDFAAMRREVRREIARPRWGWKWLTAAAAILLAAGLVTTLRKTLHSHRAVARQSASTVAARKDTVLAIPGLEPPVRRSVRTRPRPKAAIAPPQLALEEPASPVEIRLATRDPNVTIILVHETKGVMQ